MQNRKKNDIFRRFGLGALEKEEPMEADDDDTLKDLQNKRKFSTFGINPNFEPFADSFGSTLFLT